MPNKYISALLTLALGLWFLTGFSLLVTPCFQQGDQWALFLPHNQFLGMMLFGFSLGKGLAPPPGQDSLVCLPLITIRMSIWTLQSGVQPYTWECPNWVSPSTGYIKRQNGGGRPTSGKF